MLVPAMTLPEVCKEINRDYPNFYEKIIDEKNRTRRKFIKAVLFPVISHYSWKSKSGNTWKVILLARDRNERKCPAMIPYLKYEKTTGKGIIWLKIMYDRIGKFDFHPHFLERYKERALTPNGLDHLSFDEQVEHFFLNRGLFHLDTSEGANEKRQNGFVGYTNNGVLFGNAFKELDYFHVNTYVSSSMLFEQQSSQFRDMEELRQKIESHPDFFIRKGHFFDILEDGNFLSWE